MLKAICKKIIGRNVQGICDINDLLQADAFIASFNVADVLSCKPHLLAKIFLRHSFIHSVPLYAITYTFVINGHMQPILSLWPAIGSSILPSGNLHSNSSFKMVLGQMVICCTILG